MKILNFSFIILLFSLKNLYAENKLANDIVIEFHKSLRCLVCEGQSIYDSNAEFANNIKEQTESMLREGKSLVEIENLYLDIYGEEILLTPKFNRKNFFIWLLPYMCIAVFAFFYFRV